MLLVRFLLLPLRGSVVVVSLKLNRQRCLRSHITQRAHKYSLPYLQVGSLCNAYPWITVSRNPIRKATDMVVSASFSAETSVRSYRKLFIFIIYTNYFLDQSIQKIFYSEDRSTGGGVQVRMLLVLVPSVFCIAQ